MSVITYRATGRKVYRTSYVDPIDGQKRRPSIGSNYVKAIAQHQAIQDDVSAGRSPMGVHVTLNVFFRSHYMPLAVERKSSASDDKSRYTNHIEDVLGDRKITEVTLAEQRQFIAKIQTGGNRHMRRQKLSVATINRIIALLKAIWRVAHELGFVRENIARGLRLLKEDNQRTRLISSEEWAAIGRHLGQIPKLAGLMFQFLAATGMRFGEAQKARWVDLDAAGEVLVLPKTKGGRPRVVPLSAEAMHVIAQLRSLRRNDYLFPASRGDGPMSHPRKQFVRLLKLAGISESTWLHDIRRAVLTAVSRQPGASIDDVRELAGHRSVRTTQRYIVGEDLRQRAALKGASAGIHAHLHCGSGMRLKPSSASLIVYRNVRWISARGVQLTPGSIHHPLPKGVSTMR